jgi:ferritin-like metal-binding protein YciE
MSTADSLKTTYAEEMKDLWSANNQMARVVQVMADKAHDPKLKQALVASIEGINA